MPLYIRNSSASENICLRTDMKSQSTVATSKHGDHHSTFPQSHPFKRTRTMTSANLPSSSSTSSPVSTTSILDTEKLTILNSNSSANNQRLHSPSFHFQITSNTSSWTWNTRSLERHHLHVASELLDELDLEDEEDHNDRPQGSMKKEFHSESH